MSVHSIVRYGWLELGFQESYFIELLAQHGWTVSKVSNPATTLGLIYIAERAAR